MNQNIDRDLLRKRLDDAASLLSDLWDVESEIEDILGVQLDDLQSEFIDPLAVGCDADDEIVQDLINHAAKTWAEREAQCLVESAASAI